MSVGGTGKYPFLVAGFISQVGHFIPTAVPDSFDRIDLVEGAVSAGVVLHIVEDEELGFRSDVSGIPDAGALQIGFGLFGNVTGVPGIGLASVTGSTMLPMSTRVGIS